MKNIKKIFLSLFLFLLLALPALAETGAQKALKGLNETAEKGFDESIITDINRTDPSIIIGKVIGAGLTFVGVIFLILIIYAGFTWMLARGNEAEAKKAKDLLVDAVIGLVIIMSAYAITAFIGSQLNT